MKRVDVPANSTRDEIAHLVMYKRETELPGQKHQTSLDSFPFERCAYLVERDCYPFVIGRVIRDF
jgi:hypothetical protein